jgi:hypothetical protein
MAMNYSDLIYYILHDLDELSRGNTNIIDRLEANIQDIIIDKPLDIGLKEKILALLDESIKKYNEETIKNKIRSIKNIIVNYFENKIFDNDYINKQNIGQYQESWTPMEVDNSGSESKSGEYNPSNASTIEVVSSDDTLKEDNILSSLPNPDDALRHILAREFTTDVMETDVMDCNTYNLMKSFSTLIDNMKFDINSTNDRKKIIELLYKAQNYLFTNQDVITNKNHSFPDDLELLLAFDILFLNVMWWIVDGLGHDLIYSELENLSIEDLWEQSKKILPAYKHKDALNFLKQSTTNEKTKLNIRKLMDKIMLEVGLAYEVNIICPTGIYKTNPESGVHNYYDEFETFMNNKLQFIPDDSGKKRMLQIRVDSAVSDFFKTFMKTYCESNNDNLLNNIKNELTNSNSNISYPNTSSIQIGDTSSIAKYLQYNQDNSNIKNLCNEVINGKFGSNWCGASVDTTVQKDPLGMRPETMVINSGYGEFIQEDKNTDYTNAGMFDVIEENRADKIPINDLMFAPIVYKYVDNYYSYYSLAQTTTYRKSFDKIKEEYVKSKYDNKFLEELNKFDYLQIIFQDIYFPINFSIPSEKYSIHYIFNSDTAERAGVRKITKQLRYIFTNKQITNTENTISDCNEDIFYFQKNNNNKCVIYYTTRDKKSKILFYMSFSSELLSDSNMLIFATALLKTEGDYAQAIPSMQNNSYKIEVKNSIVGRNISSEKIFDTCLSIDYLAAIKNIMFSLRDLVCVTVTHGPATMITPIIPQVSGETKEKAKKIICTICNLIPKYHALVIDPFTTNQFSSFDTSRQGRMTPKNDMIKYIIDKAIKDVTKNIENIIDNFFTTNCNITLGDLNDFINFKDNLIRVIKKQYELIIHDRINEIIRYEQQIYDPLQVINILIDPKKITTSVPLLSTIYKDVNTYYINLAGYNEEFKYKILCDLQVICNFLQTKSFQDLFSDAVKNCDSIVKYLYMFVNLWASNYKYNNSIILLLLLIPSIRNDINNDINNDPYFQIQKTPDTNRLINQKDAELLFMINAKIQQIDETDETDEPDETDETDETSNIELFRIASLNSDDTSSTYQVNSQMDTGSDSDNSPMDTGSDSDNSQMDMGSDDENDICQDDNNIISCSDIIKLIKDDNFEIAIADNSKYTTNMNLDIIIEELALCFKLSYIPEETIIEYLTTRSLRGLQVKTATHFIQSRVNLTADRGDKDAIVDTEKEKKTAEKAENKEKDEKKKIYKAITTVISKSSTPKFTDEHLDAIKQFYEQNYKGYTPSSSSLQKDSTKPFPRIVSPSMLYATDIRNKMNSGDTNVINNLVNFIYNRNKENETQVNNNKQFKKKIDNLINSGYKKSDSYLKKANDKYTIIRDNPNLIKKYEKKIIKDYDNATKELSKLNLELHNRNQELNYKYIETRINEIMSNINRIETEKTIFSNKFSSPNNTGNKKRRSNDNISDKRKKQKFTKKRDINSVEDDDETQQNRNPKNTKRRKRGGKKGTNKTKKNKKIKIKIKKYTRKYRH